MDFSLTKEQKMFKDSARAFFSKQWNIEMLRETIATQQGYHTENWNKIADLGWLGMLIDERYQGIGSSFIDVCPVIEEMGRTLFPSPFLATSVVGASIIKKYANEKIKERLLPQIADGRIIVTFAVGESGDTWSENEIFTVAEKNGQSYILNGTKLFVPYAQTCDYIICCVKEKLKSDERISIFIVDTKDKGVKCSIIPTFSTDQYCKIVFDNCVVPEENIIGNIGHGWDIIEKTVPKLVISQCMMMVGGLQKVLEMTVKWAKEREQFGVPIGSFQTISHYCAEMAIEVEASKLIAYQAAWKTSNGLSCKKEISMAKAYAGEAFQKVTSLALQVHGAMGFTEEYDLHFYYKQAKSMQLMNGSGKYHRKIVAQEMGYQK